jgi:integrase
MAGFVVSLQSRPPLSARQLFTFAKEFFNHYDLELPAKDLKFIRNKLPKGSVRTIERDMDTETIRTILQHLDVKGKALVLVLASSGMRIGEALSLPLEDIDLKAKPAVVTVRGMNTKTGDNRITFLSTEATQAVNEWLKVRPDYIRSSANRNNGLAKHGRGSTKTGEDDGRLFPFSDQNASVLWDNAVEKAGLFSRDKETNRKQLHYHQLRKFFISQLSLIISKEVAEMLAGHSGYLTGAYRRYTKKQLAEEYLKGQHLLTIQAPKELQEIESEFKAKMQTHSEIIENLVKKNIRLEEQMAKKDAEFDLKIQRIEDEIHQLYQQRDELQNWLGSLPEAERKVWLELTLEFGTNPDAIERAEADNDAYWKGVCEKMANGASIREAIRP